MLRPPYDRLIEEFRAAAVRFAGQPTWLLAVRTDEASGFDVAGFASLWEFEPGTRRTYHFGPYREDSQAEWWATFKDLASVAGAQLPVRVHDRLAWTRPSSPLACWMAFVWARGTERPAPIGAGKMFLQPFLLSARAIERSKTLQQPAVEFSLPQRPRELARRILGKQAITVTEKRRALKGLTLIPFKEGGVVRPRLFVVALDGLPGEVQARLREP